MSCVGVPKREIVDWDEEKNRGVNISTPFSDLANLIAKNGGMFRSTRKGVIQDVVIQKNGKAWVVTSSGYHPNPSFTSIDLLIGWLVQNTVVWRWALCDGSCTFSPSKDVSRTTNMKKDICACDLSKTDFCSENFMLF